ncbi:Protein of unknown function [Propionibacterium freudenreichii]|nr:Protein of unknown function [Propionibacterium freudenreichii]
MVLAVLGVATIAWQLSPAGEWLRHWVRTGGGTAHIGGASNVARGLVMLVDPGSIGAWRFVAALGCCHVVATGLTLGFASLIASQWPRWSDALVNGWSNGAIPALLGVAMAASGGGSTTCGVSARDGSVWRSPSPWASTTPRPSLP